MAKIKNIYLLYGLLGTLHTPKKIEMMFQLNGLPHVFDHITMTTKCLTDIIIVFYNLTTTRVAIVVIISLQLNIIF